MNDYYNALPTGFRLQEYEVLRVLGVGGFGITYLCFDHNLDQARAIKEYLPNELAVRLDDNTVSCKSSQSRQDFDDGLVSFVAEAKKLALFHHDNIVKVHRSFAQHGTSYIVMEYAEGDTLSEVIKARKVLPEKELLNILLPIMDGLEVVHNGKFLHRDIKPGNIIIRDKDNSPVLLDFGSARQSMESRSKSITAIVTAGYAPFEQYSSHGNQGPWTDIYALGCLAYRLLSGEIPKEAPLRMRNDPQVSAVKLCAGKASPTLLKAIDWAMAVYEEDRPQSIQEWREAIKSGVIPTQSNEDVTRKTVTATVSSTQKNDKKKSSAPMVAGVGILFAAAAGAFFLWPKPEEPAVIVTPPIDTGSILDEIEPEVEPEPELDITFPGTEFQENLADGNFAPAMITIPSGSFTMGNQDGSGDVDEMPAHTINISQPFALGKFEVSIAEFIVFTQATERTMPESASTQETLPVTYISWQDAQDYADWLSEQTGAAYRLPSEAEWEYAASAMAGTAYAWGNNIGSGMAACSGCTTGQQLSGPQMRGSYAPNRFGLYDMQGNVWEWLSDCARDNYIDAPEDGSIWASDDLNCSKLLRGGSWDSNPYSLRTNYRNWDEPNNMNNSTGFRLLREIQP